jgi:hypothetical protein
MGKAIRADVAEAVTDAGGAAPVGTASPTRSTTVDLEKFVAEPTIAINAKHAPSINRRQISIGTIPRARGSDRQADRPKD